MNDGLARIFKLASPGDAHGVSCERDGAFVGPIPLVEKRGSVWHPRAIARLNAELSAQYGIAVDISSRSGGLGVIAKALNDNNIVKAKIAAVQLRLPNIPVLPNRNSLEVINFAHKLFETGILSKAWDPEKHPRWPSGQTDGGRFRPADETSSDQIDRPAPTEQIAADPAKFTECNEKCSKLLERYKTYRWSNVNEFHYRQCMNQCLGIG